MATRRGPRQRTAEKASGALMRIVDVAALQRVAMWQLTRDHQTPHRSTLAVRAYPYGDPRRGGEREPKRTLSRDVYDFLEAEIREHGSARVTFSAYVFDAPRQERYWREHRNYGSAALVRDFQYAFVPMSVSMDAERTYPEWQSQRIGHFIFRRNQRFRSVRYVAVPMDDEDASAVVEHESIGRFGGVAGARLAAFKELRITMRARFPAPFVRLDGAMEASEVPAQRRLIAEWRILEPLLEYEESAFIEPHWSELSERDLTDFIRQGITREVVLARFCRPMARVVNRWTSGEPPHKTTARVRKSRTARRRS